MVGRSAATTAYTAGSAGLAPKVKAARTAARERAAGTPIASPAPARIMAWRSTMPRTSPVCAQRHADADLARAPRNSPRHDAIDSYQRQDEREAGEDGEEAHCPAARAGRFAHDFLHGAHLGDSPIRIHRVNGATQRASRRRWIAAGAHDRTAQGWKIHIHGRLRIETELFDVAHNGHDGRSCGSRSPRTRDKFHSHGIASRPKAARHGLVHDDHRIVQLTLREGPAGSQWNTHEAEIAGAYARIGAAGSESGLTIGLPGTLKCDANARFASSGRVLVGAGRFERPTPAPKGAKLRWTPRLRQTDNPLVAVR